MTYEVIDVEANWPRIRAALEVPAVRAAYNAGLTRWHDESFDEYPRFAGAYDVDRALAGELPAPWELSKSDYWCMEIDARIEAAAEEYDSDAEMAKTAGYLQCLLGEYAEELPGLSDLEQRFRAKFEPTGLDWWVPRNSCHYLTDFTPLLAEQVLPDGKWKALRGDAHSTTICHRTRRCFDLLAPVIAPTHPMGFTKATAPEGY